MKKKAAKKRSTGNPRGRPPRADDNSTAQIRVRFTDDERDEIERKCEKLGLTMAEAVRMGLIKIGVLSP